MRKTIVHTKETAKHIISNYLLALLPLFLYGLYKNWIYVYMRGFVSFGEIVKQLLLVLITLAIPLAIEYISCLIANKKIKTKDLLESWNILFAFLFFLIMPVKYNRAFYIILLAIYTISVRILSRIKLSLNPIALLKIVAIFLLMFLGGYNYANTYEVSRNISYSLFNSFFGRTIGEFGTTNIFLVLLGYFYLASRKHYKKEIPFYAILSYIVCSLVICLLLKGNYYDIIRNCITTNICFALVFIATIPMYSPYTKEGICIYAILTGIVGCILMQFLNRSLGIYFAILLTSSVAKLLDFLVIKVKR